ncbi:hypothetical protein EW145_g1044 [Phellinidium pouzarii]|uniref:Thioredoxin domain-containing protein n=1 Tax=Phellinidium pouzarii TaxID=167371 RepID=A0A4S4LFZ2_9AGAM|nr:hypothetical protein EW145_g1044 [Phellinidium pouzarii]
MSAFRSVLQLASKPKPPACTLGTRTIARTSIDVSLRRTFRSSACRRVHYLDVEPDTMLQVLTDSKSQDKVVLVDFYADWCQPCKMLSPILEKLTANENAESVKTGSGLSLDLVTVNADTQAELLQKFNVQSLPTVIAFKDGKPESRFIGAVSERVVREFIAKL